MSRIALLGLEGRMGQAISALAPCEAFSESFANKPDVVIDFSSPEGTAEAARVCAEHGIPLVSGTTSLTDSQQAEIKKAVAKIAIVQSGNMSLGVTLLRSLVKEAAARLQSFDIEVLETHHRHKQDSPSGTALLLGEAAA